MPGFAGAKNKSFDQPYIVAKLSACPLAAENLMEIASPGITTGEAPVFLKLPYSTNGFESNTFSIVIVVADVDGIASFLLQAIISKGIAAIAHKIECLCFIMNSF
ncbi:hypothetical protein D3C73_933280 [compost metagenome]